jgi:hypothetical protein
MPDNSDHDKAEIKEAIKADVKSLQQLSSSGRAAQRKREENQVQRASRAVEEAVERLLTQEAKSEKQGKSR